MKSLWFAIALLVVAALAYEVGTKHAAPPAVSTALPPTQALPESQPRQRPISPMAHTKPASDAPPNAPYAQNLTASQRGYKAAEEDIESALKQVETLPVPERMGFISGIFSFVARHRTPAEALTIYQSVPEAQRPNALRALVGEWIYTRSPLDEDTRYIKREGVLTISGSRTGLELELTSMLASTKPDPELAATWLDAFSGHSARSEILAMLVGQLPRDGAELLARTQDWTPWEKERVTRRFLSDLASENPENAWSWYQENKSPGEDLTASIVAPWAARDPDAVKNLLDRLTDPNERMAVIGAVGNALARKDTHSAVAWADSLANADERAAAQRAVYTTAPRGIGAILKTENGFPTLTGVVPGSPLEGAGGLAGDQLIEVRFPDGTSHSLFGSDLNTAINLIRGEAGSELTLRILRRNASSGFEERLIPVTRGQLYLNEKFLPETGKP